jgi:hypothetical protein
VILTIDVTVTGPDGVMTGSTAVTVNEPEAVTPPAPERAAGDLANLRMRQRTQALRGGVSRA